MTQAEKLIVSGIVLAVAGVAFAVWGWAGALVGAGAVELAFGLFGLTREDDDL